MIKKIFQRIGTPFQPKNELMPVDIKSLEKVINYAFQNKSLLLQAMKHRSYLSQNGEQEHYSNERLELLGDSVLELISTEHLYHAFPTENEGDLSQKRAILVSRSVLGKLVKDMGLGTYILLNKGEEKTGGRSRSSNLANLFESILGAIYLDGGYAQAKKFADKFLLSQRDALLQKEIYTNYKSTLLELSQANGWGIPEYYTVEETGPDHEKHFLISVTINSFGSAKGSGQSKKKAEQKAAKKLLEMIHQSQQLEPGYQK